ncbi:MAG: hypothetical protein V4667_05005 [Bacteroidota bacterium]
MIFDVFKFVFKSFQKEKKSQIADNSDMLMINKRYIFHKDIPDITTLRKITGINFDKLQEIFNRYDPVQTESLNENPKKYELLTRTVIYKLPRKKTREAVADLLSLEFSLWFKHAYNSFSRKEDLVNEIYEFKKKHFSNDPFEPEESKI